MAEKTIIEKAAETIGYGLAMAEDVAGTVKTAVGATVSTVSKALKNTPSKKNAAKKGVARKATKQAPAKKAIKKTAAKKSTPKKVAAKKATKQSVGKVAKKASRARQ
jgi:hypothetical protein